MRHLVNAQYEASLAGGNTGQLFLSFGGLVCADQISNCPLDRVLTYKNLIYLSNLQIHWIVIAYYITSEHVLFIDLYSLRNIISVKYDTYLFSLFCPHVFFQTISVLVTPLISTLEKQQKAVSR